jgi:hypothetical protein
MKLLIYFNNIKINQYLRNNSLNQLMFHPIKFIIRFNLRPLFLSYQLKVFEIHYISVLGIHSKTPKIRFIIKVTYVTSSFD